MKELSEIQKTKITDSLKVYIAAIPASNVEDIDEIIRVLESFKKNHKFEKEEVLASIQLAVTNLSEYIQLLIEFDSEIEPALMALLNQIIDNRIEALKETKSSQQSVEAYSRAQKRWGLNTPQGKYRIIVQARYDLCITELEESRIIDLQYHRSDFELVKAAWHNPLVRRAMQMDVDFFSYVNMIETDNDYQQAQKYAAFITNDALVAELRSYNVYNFSAFKNVSIAIFNRYITALSAPLMLAMLKDGLLVRQIIADLHIEKLEKLVERLSHLTPPAIALLAQGKIEIKNIIEVTTARESMTFRQPESEVWGKEKFEEVVETLLNPLVKPFVDRGEIHDYEVAVWGHEETLRIAKYATQPVIGNLIDRKLLNFCSINNLKKLQAQAEVLLQFQKEIEHLVHYQIIDLIGVKDLIDNSPGKCAEFILLIQRNYRYFKLRILTVFDLKEWQPQKLAELIEDLDHFPSSACQYFSDLGWPCSKLFDDRERRRVYLDMLWYPPMREILASGTLTLDQAISDFSNPRYKQILLTILYNPFLKQRLCNYRDLRNDLFLVSNVVLHRQIFPLVQFDYLTGEDVILRRHWKSEALVTLAKYKLLLKLQMKVSDPKLKTFGFLGRYFPDGISDIQAALRRLEVLRETRLDYSAESDVLVDYTSKNTIDGVFDSVFKLLKLKQPPSSSDADKKVLKKSEALYRDEYNNICKFNTVSLLGTHYEIGEFYLEQGNMNKAYEYFIQVVETQPNYHAAIRAAVNIAISNFHYEDAKYLLTKIPNIPEAKEMHDRVEKGLKEENHKFDRPFVPKIENDGAQATVRWLSK